MRQRHTFRKFLILVLGAAAIYSAVKFDYSSLPFPAQNPESLATKDLPEFSKERVTSIGWKTDFASYPASRLGSVPDGWQAETKPGTRPAEFSLASDASSGGSFLRMAADSASASLITSLDGIDLRKTPVMRWRWRAIELPHGADGRVRSKDDQAIGIYVGTGSALNNKSVSYRWDTETPKGSEGNSSYMLGAVKSKWFTLRNKEDAGGSGWIVEERNVAEDFMRAWGFYPQAAYISISCNSQYTGSQAMADLDWVQFVSVSAGETLQ